MQNLYFDQHLYNLRATTLIKIMFKRCYTFILNYLFFFSVKFSIAPITVIPMNNENKSDFFFCIRLDCY